MPRKHRADDDVELDDDDDRAPVGGASKDDDGEEDTLPLEEAEEKEKEEEDDEDEDEEFVKDSVATLESRRLFQHEAEEILESLTLDDVQEVLKDNGLEAVHTSRLKKLLVEVIEKGEVDNWEDAWEEAVRRLEEEIE